MTNPTMQPQVVVVGSHAPGLLMRVQRVPVAGETVIGWDYQEPMDGGKGSHQAIAASRLGTLTSFVGCVGRDRLGDTGEGWLRDAGCDVRYLFRSATRATGVGFILLEESGVPAMVTSLGANAELSPAQIDRALVDLRGAKVLLTQFEIRPEIALYAARKGSQLGMVAIVNPAPAPLGQRLDYSEVDILVPNEMEACTLVGLPPDQPAEPARMATDLLKVSRAGCVIITLGGEGMIGADQAGTWRVFPPKVTVADTSGAGDVFCAALAAGIAAGKSVRGASEWACQASALSVTRPGTIPAFPTQLEVEQFISSL